jgi:nitrite reductase/ring-hydroxylating ferredoxin subunit
MENSLLRVPLAHCPPDGESITLPAKVDGRAREVFLLKLGDCFYAYLNECPHWGIELDLGDGHFYRPDFDRIYCKNHGALFLPTTGLCETGPCLGRGLTRFGVRTEGDEMVIDLSERHEAVPPWAMER